MDVMGKTVDGRVILAVGPEEVKAEIEKLEGIRDFFSRCLGGCGGKEGEEKKERTAKARRTPRGGEEKRVKAAEGEGRKTVAGGPRARGASLALYEILRDAGRVMSSKELLPLVRVRMEKPELDATRLGQALHSGTGRWCLRQGKGMYCVKPD